MRYKSGDIQNAGFGRSPPRTTPKIAFIGKLSLINDDLRVVRGGERPKPAFWIFSALGRHWWPLRLRAGLTASLLAMH